MSILRKSVPIESCQDLFPDLAQLLPEINKALRNINFGKMDYLPYETRCPGYQLTMRSEIVPQGPGKPPSMGHWQIEVSRQDYPYHLILQGKANTGTELGEIVFPCGASPDSARFFNEG
jgi:hypothetical protein